MSLELASTLTLFQNAPLSFSVKPDVLRHFKINQLQSRYWFRPRHTNTSRYPSVWAFCLECAMSRSGKIRPLVWRMGTAWHWTTDYLWCSLLKGCSSSRYISFLLLASRIRSRILHHQILYLNPEPPNMNCIRSATL